MQLPGQVIKFNSIDSGCKELLKDTVDEVLLLKPGCRVMLLYNVNNHLKNGTFGTFINTCNYENIKVEFSNGVISLERKTWYKYDNAGHVQASCTQYPLSLAYATTVHKAQSTTLNSVVVHCSQEFDSGQTYVAMSRVRSEESPSNWVSKNGIFSHHHKKLPRLLPLKMAILSKQSNAVRRLNLTKLTTILIVMKITIQRDSLMT